MSETNSKITRKTKIEHVNVQMPKTLWDLTGEIAKHYGVSKIDVIKMLVYAEASRLGIIGQKK